MTFSFSDIQIHAFCANFPRQFLLKFSAFWHFCSTICSFSTTKEKKENIQGSYVQTSIASRLASLLQLYSILWSFLFSLLGISKEDRTCWRITGVFDCHNFPNLLFPSSAIVDPLPHPI